MTFNEYKVKFKQIPEEFLVDETMEQFIVSSEKTDKLARETLKDNPDSLKLYEQQLNDIPIEKRLEHSNHTKKHTYAGREFKSGDLYCYGILNETETTKRVIVFHEEEIGTLYNVVSYEGATLTLELIK